MGPIYNAYMGNPTGHYLLDLKFQQNRISGQKLAAMSTNMEAYCTHMNVHTSQKGNHSCFRNECQEGINIVTPGQWWASCPSSGKIHLDFASTDRPPEGSQPISDARFRGLVTKLGLRDISPLNEKL